VSTSKAPLYEIKKKARVAIVGGADSWVNAPFDDKSWEIWVIGNQINQYQGKRVDIIFEIHNDLSNRKDGYAKWLTDFNFPMVVGEQFPDKTVNCEVFDFSKAREMMDGNYLTSTPSYMTAYALYSRPDIEEIGYWGVDMGVDNQEYFYEQPCINRWIGFCRGKGVKITLPEGCPLGEPDYMEGVTANHPEPRHPYSEKDLLELEREHAQKIDGFRKQITELERLVVAHDGARQVYEKLAKVGRATDAGQVYGNLLQTLRVKSGKGEKSPVDR